MSIVAPTSDDASLGDYAWVLDPLPTVGDLLRHLGDEASRLDSCAAAWRREESRINLYLLACAIGCAVDDCLAYRRWDAVRIGGRFPSFSRPAEAATAILNLPHTLKIPERRVRSWRPHVERCIDEACAVLLGGEGDAASRARLAGAIDTLSRSALPAAVLGWRARIPEAFRCQDLSHHDVLALARHFVDSQSGGAGPLVVLGPRTAGAYFAPLIKAFLADQRLPVRGWMTLRPKYGLSPAEGRRLKRLLEGAAHVVVVDDHPNTGHTFTLVTRLLQHLGVRPEDISLLAPDHPAQRNWKQRIGPVRTVTLPYAQQYKPALLGNERAMAELFAEIFRGQGWDFVGLETADPAVDAVNARLASRLGETFEVRAKRLFAVRLMRPGQPPTVKHVLAKSVGWGWLGYHAWLAGLRLDGYVPPVVALRQGLLFTEWVGPLATGAEPPDGRRIMAALPAYLAARSQRLRLDGDPCLTATGYRWTGRDTLVATLCRPLAGRLHPLQLRRMRARLVRKLAYCPTLLDGRLGPEEWIDDGGRLTKADFEHHNFGGAQQDLTDPAYDLAGAIYELAVSAADEPHVVDSYAAATGDRGIRSRLDLYKLLYGIVTMRTAAHGATHGISPHFLMTSNRRYAAARDFLTFQIGRSLAAVLPAARTAAWSEQLFCLDLDGVFDAEWFGAFFPHTTPSGLLALRLLQAQGWSVVLNTGRSLGHVREYCRIHGLPGGVAEYGCVFRDAVNSVELPLVEQVAVGQLRRCRQLVADLPGVFTDPGYQWAIRAYRFRGDTTVGLPKEELAGLFSRHGLHALTAISREADSYVVPKGVDKGTALRAVIRSLDKGGARVVAIGDSLEDLPMLRNADVAYVPANGDTALQGFHRVRQSRQRGLLAAVRHLLGDDARTPVPSPSDTEDHLLFQLLRAAEGSGLRKLAFLLR